MTNSLEQYGHLKSLLEECVRRWSCRLDECVKLLLQCVHWKGLSPECVRSCCLRFDVWEKDFEQMEQV